MKGPKRKVQSISNSLYICIPDAVKTQIEDEYGQEIKAGEYLRFDIDKKGNIIIST